MTDSNDRRGEPGRHRRGRHHGTSRRATLLGALAAPAALSAFGAAAPARADGVVTGPYVHAVFETIAEHNATDQDVQAIQSLLRYRGRTVPWSQTYDAALAAAVAGYQRSVGLNGSGRFDGATARTIQGPARAGEDSWLTRALHYLLNKHGYAYPPGTLSYFSPQTRLNLNGFQGGHYIARKDHVDQQTWMELFAPPNSGPAYPLLQRGTGAAQWSNCGPASAVVMLLNLGKIPTGWNGLTYATDRKRTVENFRYGAMEVANTAARNARGTEFPQFQTGLGKYGLTPRQGSVSEVLAAAREGRPSVCGGDANTLPWDNYVNGPVSHWIAVLGWNGTSYLVVDPICRDSSNQVHFVSQSTLLTYGATNPGYYQGHPTMAPPSKNNILLVP
ncbi:peptidoglycan-binding protein [Dermacoccaceae bacterium W4C1]